MAMNRSRTIAVNGRIISPSVGSACVPDQAITRLHLPVVLPNVATVTVISLQQSAAMIRGPSVTDRSPSRADFKEQIHA
jgi:hypothetical protein